MVRHCYLGKNILGLSDREASLSWVTNASKSFCRCSLPARAFFWSSGLYLCTTGEHAAGRMYLARWIYLEEFFLCRRDVPDEGRPTYAEKGASAEQLET